MNKHLFTTTALLLILVLLYSCKKDDNKPTITIVGKWKQVSGTYSPAYFGETDYFTSYNVCEKDDIIEFKANNTFEASEGATKCDASDPQIYQTGDYQVNTGLISITINGEPSAIEVSANALKVTHSFSEAGITYSEIMTFQRQ